MQRERQAQTELKEKLQFTESAAQATALSNKQLADAVAVTEAQERATAQKFLEDLSASRQMMMAENATFRQQAAEHAQSLSSASSSNLQEHAHVSSVVTKMLKRQKSHT